VWDVGGRFLPVSDPHDFHLFVGHDDVECLRHIRNAVETQGKSGYIQHLRDVTPVNPRELFEAPGALFKTGPKKSGVFGI
jgi:hypothetical protein